MDDSERQEWSRHYDRIQWTVISLFTAGVGALFAYSLRDRTAALWPEIAGVLVTFLGVFYVASFRSFRNNLHCSIVDKQLRAFLKHPSGRRHPGQWDAFVISFFVVDVVFIYKLAKNSGHLQVGFPLGVALGAALLTLLWRMGRPREECASAKGASGGRTEEP